MGILVGVWIARHLGPEQFGLLNFALAFTGLFGAIATLGLQGIVVRDIVRDPESARLTLGSAAMLQVTGGLGSYLLILGAIAYLRPDDTLSRTIVAILGAMMLLRASDIAVYWFESQVQSKYTVWVQNGVFLIFAAIKVGLILKGAALVTFAWATLVEITLVAILMLVVFNLRGHSITQLRAGIGRAKTLLRDSWPLILSGTATSVYMKIDQVMLGQLVGDQAVGIYSAAVRISEFWYFIPLAIVGSVFPAIIEAKKQSEEKYYARLQKLYDLMAIISLALAIPMLFLSGPLINLLFGVDFADAGSVLAIHIWAAIFVFLGVASGNWLLTENLQKLALQRALYGALTNILLNLLLIPKFGVNGAAVALVVSQAVAFWLIDGLQSATRKMFFMKLSAMNPFTWHRLIIFNKL